MVTKDDTGQTGCTLKITRWMDSLEDEIREVCVETIDENSWVDIDERRPVALETALDLSDARALLVEVVEGSVDSQKIASFISGGPSVVTHSWDFGPETGNEVIDAVNDDGGPPVVIEGTRFGHFSVGSDYSANQLWVWLECDPNELSQERARPAVAQPIAMCGGIEWDSRTSGSSYWSVDELPDGRICYSFDEDEEMFYILLEERDGRSDSEVAMSLSRMVWEPAGAALAHAVETGQNFSGYASVLGAMYSESAEVGGYIYFSSEPKDGVNG